MNSRAVWQLAREELDDRVEARQEGKKGGVSVPYIDLQHRVRIEHLIRHLKIFHIFAGRYRNRRKRFGLRLNLIAGLLNYQLAHAA